MDTTYALQGLARRVAVPPTPGRAGRAAVLTFVLFLVGGFLTVLWASGAYAMVTDCASAETEGGGWSTDAARVCERELRLELIAYAVALGTPLMAVLLLTAGALATAGALLSGYLGRRGRRRRTEDRLGRLEDLYARGLVAPERYEELRSRLTGVLRCEAPAEVAREERRWLAWNAVLVPVLSLPLVVGAYLVSKWGFSAHAEVTAEAPHPWFFWYTLVLWGTVTVLLVHAWWRASRSDSVAFPAHTAHLEATWADLLNEVRENRTAPTRDEQA